MSETPYGPQEIEIRKCDLTLVSPEDNLATDEALLDQCDDSPDYGVLRLWEPDRHFVVVGYANQVNREVNLAFCHRNRIPVFRRCSGGGTVMQGPGSLNYSLILPIRAFPALEGIHTTNSFILGRHAKAVSRVIEAPVEHQGDTDLAIGGVKFAGNAQRRKRRALLFHGTILLNVDLELMEQVLPMPSKQPAYRANRSHRDFLINLRADPKNLKNGLCLEWQARRELQAIPFGEISRMVSEKYSREKWNLKF